MGTLTTSDANILKHMSSVAADIIQICSKQSGADTSVTAVVSQLVEAKAILDSTLQSIGAHAPLIGMPDKANALKGAKKISARIKMVGEDIETSKPLKDRTRVYHDFMAAARTGFCTRKMLLTEEMASEMRRRFFRNDAAALTKIITAIDSYIRVVKKTGAYEQFPMPVPGG